MRRLLDTKRDRLASLLQERGVKVSNSKSHYGGQINPQWISNTLIGFQAHLSFGHLFHCPAQYELHTNKLKVCFDPHVKADYHLRDVVWIDSINYYAIQDRKANFLYDEPKYHLNLVFGHSGIGIVDTLFQEMLKISDLCYNPLKEQLYYVSDDTREPKAGDFIFSYQLDTGVKKRITEGFSPTVSPEGTAIAFVRKTSKEMNAIYVRDLDSEVEEKILDLPGYIEGLAWTKHSNRPK